MEMDGVVQLRYLFAFIPVISTVWLIPSGLVRIVSNFTADTEQTSERNAQSIIIYFIYFTYLVLD